MCPVSHAEGSFRMLATGSTAALTCPSRLSTVSWFRDMHTQAAVSIYVSTIIVHLTTHACARQSRNERSRGVSQRAVTYIPRDCVRTHRTVTCNGPSPERRAHSTLGRVMPSSLTFAAPGRCRAARRSIRPSRTRRLPAAVAQNASEPRLSLSVSGAIWDIAPFCQVAGVPTAPCLDFCPHPWFRAR